MPDSPVSLAERMAQSLSDVRFREHVTRTAFLLSLSLPQINGLLALNAGERFIPKSVLSTLNYKGLTDWKERAAHQSRVPCLTDAGVHVVGLLKIAGFSYPPPEAV